MTAAAASAKEGSPSDTKAKEEPREDVTEAVASLERGRKPRGDGAAGFPAVL